MKERVYRHCIELTNGRWSSALIKKFAYSKWSRYMIPSFAKVYQINIGEMEKQLNEYRSLHEFFIRKLKANSRKIDAVAGEIISPVDAVIEDIGKVKSDQSIIVKGKTYSIYDMLGDEKIVKKYVGGTYLIFYLSPSHYHRIHCPATGIVIKRWTLGNKSYPVNKYGLKWGKSTLSRNYRSITEIKTEEGTGICMVKVGAMFINSIILSHHKEHLVQGEEMAYFSFGSTVVLLFEKNTFIQKDFPSMPYPVKIGEVIGEMRKKV
ncbi:MULTISPECIES: phosphatidylserine decarboxylase [Bacillaceae]|uniref:phosphatidylserine decarboxylase n=1 Tax=Bacillaceae TaxID=186817 RepID=UPI0004E0D400|nr:MULTISPECIES: phosphatidylserine decarboxylase [Bacillaceae]MCF2646835.1 phosphatidylserine decarboxylase [Niallia circulans]CAI9388460.1 Phosphatidylserine decarboxylase proenzyme [Bacillus sp. T2.9-1]